MKKNDNSLQIAVVLIKIFAMAGGPETLDDIADYPGFLDEGWRFPGLTAEWLAFGALNDEVQAKEERERTAASERSV